MEPETAVSLIGLVVGSILVPSILYWAKSIRESIKAGDKELADQIKLLQQGIQKAERRHYRILSMMYARGQKAPPGMDEEDEV